MPHPERAIEAVLGSDDGVVLLQSFLGAAADHRAAHPLPTAALAR
jgi:hypothetical protein